MEIKETKEVKEVLLTDTTTITMVEEMEAIEDEIEEEMVADGTIATDQSVKSVEKQDI